MINDFEELRQAKAQCLRDITEALPRYIDRLWSVDKRLSEYIYDALSNDGSHANLYELLGIRKEMRLESLIYIGRIVAIVRDEFEETLRKAVEQCMT